MQSIQQNRHQSTCLEEIFDALFFDAYQTRLIGNVAEPLYLPAKQDECAIIYYRDDYFASALHEIAHWCIAGEARRQCQDYGYWYNADGRTAKQQSAFLDVEVKPQSLEWVFSVAAGFPFDVSLDNLNAVPQQTDWEYWQAQKELKRQFIRRCEYQIDLWFKTGFPSRAQMFIEALVAYFRSHKKLTFEDFRGQQWD